MRKALLVLLCILLLLLTGCYDAVDLNEQIFAVNLALDTGEGAALRLTVQYPQITPTGKQPAQTNSDLQKNGYILHQVEGETIQDCLELMHMVTPRRMSLMQLRGIYLSDSLAKDNTLLRGCVTALADARVARPAAQVHITRGRAEDVLRKQLPLFGARLSKALEAQNKALCVQGVIPSAPLKRFAAALDTPDGTSIAVLTAVNNGQYLSSPPARGMQPAASLAGELPRGTADAVDLCGSTLLNPEGLLFLDGYETQLINVLTGDLRTLDLTAKGRTVRLTFRRTPKIAVKTDADAPRIIVQLPVRVHDADAAQVTEMLVQDVLSLLLKLQQHGLDPIGLSDRARMHAQTIAEWEEMAREELYARAVIEVMCIDAMG